MILPLAALSIALTSLKGFGLCSDLCSSVDVAIRYFGNVSSFVVVSFFNLCLGSVSMVLY